MPACRIDLGVMSLKRHASSIKLVACGLWLVAAVAPLAAAKWTVMVYMCADNGMSDQSYVDLAEMTRAGSTPDVNIIVEVDRPEYDSLSLPRRYRAAPGRLELLGELPELDMADPANLADFVRFCRDEYSADKYLLVLWDHGNGWPESLAAQNRDCPRDFASRNPGLSLSSPERAILYDASSGHALGVAGGGLRAAMNEVRNVLGRKVAILALDACLMQMIEVAWEVKDCAEVMVSSEDLQPFNGFPYDTFLQILTASPALSPRDYARLLPDLFTQSYSEGSQGSEAVTLSSLDLAKLEPAVHGLAHLLDTISAQAPGAPIQQARREVQTFACEYSPPNRFNDNVDLGDFLRRTADGRRTLDFDRLVLACSSNDPSLASARGIAVWFPDNYLALKARYQEYAGLGFAAASGWLHFLNCFFHADDVKPAQVEAFAGPVGRRNDFRLNWTRAFDMAPVEYEVRNYAAITDVFSDPAEDLGNWQADGFTLQEFQGRSVFYSGTGSNLNNSLTLRAPLVLTGDALVSFSIWSNTRETIDTLGDIYRDVCYLEVSRDTVTWTALDSFYGAGLTWRRARRIVRSAEFTTKTAKDTKGACGVRSAADDGRRTTDDGLWLRFRFQTSSGPHVAGVYLDSVLVQSLAAGERLPALPTQRDTCAIVFNAAQGDAYYLVIPCDSFGNVGDVSSPVRAAVPDYAVPYSIPSPIVAEGPQGLNATLAEIVCDYPNGITPDVSILTLNGELVRRYSKVSFHRIAWAADNNYGVPVASGVYLVVVKAGSFVRRGCIAVVR